MVPVGDEARRAGLGGGGGEQSGPQGEGRGLPGGRVCLWLPFERRPAESAWSSVGGMSGEALSPPPLPGLCGPRTLRAWSLGAGWEMGHPGLRDPGPELGSPLHRRGGGAKARERAELALLTAVREQGG